MDITKVKNTEDLYSWVRHNYFTISAAIIIILALAVRLSGITYKTWDYHIQISWFEHFTKYGLLGFQTIYSETSANYPPLFMLAYALLAQLPQPTEVHTQLYMRLPQFLTDFMMSLYVYKIIVEVSRSKIRALFALGAFLFLPTPLINSSPWAQVDILYSFFAIIAVYYLYKEKYIVSFLLLGLSISFKTMGVFLLPLFILISAYKKLNPAYFSLTAIPHLAVSLFVCLFFKAPLLKTILVLFKQLPMGLCRNSTNLSAFISSANIITFGFVWLISLTIFACMIFYYIFPLKKKSLTLESMMLWSLITTTSVIFFLPNMHDRFFMIPEILSLIYVFIKPRYFYIALVIHLASFSTYLNYLLGMPIFPLRYAALIMLLGLCLLYRILYLEEYIETPLV